MNKLLLIFFAILIATMLGACSNNTATDEEEVKEVVSKEIKENTTGDTHAEDQINKSSEALEVASTESGDVYEASEGELITQQKVEDLSEVLTYFENFGYTVEIINDMQADMVDAKKGVRARINGTDLEFYEYDPNNPKAAETMKRINETGRLLDQSSVILNGNFLMFNYKYHPDKEALIGIFQSINSDIE
ncbi:hypothetical protein [Metabacillus schmidteae]|uniref:hypothetical protein n=1 Tax=Metabacillus schmidteae TaxID=2730405 RepID=UPI00158D1987|nr:hypothetical protein [Metabacillus schmidteae]